MVGDDVFEEIAEPVWSKIVLSNEVDELFHSPIGRYLLKKAQNDMDMYLSKFLDTHFESVEEARALQSKAHGARLAIIWLNEALYEGRALLRGGGEESSPID